MVNSVKAWKCQKVGEKASGGHIVKTLVPSFFMCHILHNGVDWSGVSYWREEFFSRLGSWSINTGLNAADVLLGSFASFENRDLVRVLLSD